jgi:hypothetical protein
MNACIVMNPDFQKAFKTQREKEKEKKNTPSSKDVKTYQMILSAMIFG